MRKRDSPVYFLKLVPTRYKSKVGAGIGAGGADIIRDLELEPELEPKLSF